jgi:hypothetical protein
MRTAIRSVRQAVATAATVALLVTPLVRSAHAQTGGDRIKVLQAAAYALGMPRWSDIGTTTTRLPAIDIVNTMELRGSGTVDRSGRAMKVDYHAALGYNPPAMRVEMTLTGEGGAPQHIIQTVRETYAWDESEIGAGLVPGKGTATPIAASARERLLQVWTLPYGVVKAAVAAGDKTTVSTEGGATVVTFPLSGALAGITVRATLDANNLVTRVETRSDNPALVTQTDYADYADRAEVLTDIKTPGRIVRRQGGRTVLDIEVKNWETNNPYLVFPVPPNLKAPAAANSR